MDSLEIKGKTYKKTAVLAEKYGYTSDYLGQLCREEKVEAEMVGRSWYISEESLQAHRDGRHQKEESVFQKNIKKEQRSSPSKSTTLTNKNEQKTAAKGRSVSLQKEAMQSLQNVQNKKAAPLLTIPSYDEDDSPLIPKLFSKKKLLIEALSPPEWGDIYPVSVPIQKVYSDVVIPKTKQSTPAITSEVEGFIDEKDELWFIPNITEYPIIQDDDVVNDTEKIEATPLNRQTHTKQKNSEKQSVFNKKTVFPKKTKKKLQINWSFGYSKVGSLFLKFVRIMTTLLLLVCLMLCFAKVVRVYTVVQNESVETSFRFESELPFKSWSFISLTILE